ncbi:MAG TPA: NAD-dependent epimerase/dehydratase family protein [Acidimicrobiales bacterium]|nr:NAD-dependent epimerase/dehydratase family protein [Acidimicrobiales bacterium]
MARRVLITGLASFWGGLTALALEQDPEVETIVGLDTIEPSIQLRRTEYVRADHSYSILARIVAATRVDTIVHTFLSVNSRRRGNLAAHEQNVIGTMNLLAAASAPGSTVRQVVVKSSTLVYGSSAEDPTWFREDTARPGTARTQVERSLIEVEDYLADFAEDNPERRVTVLRFSNVLGEGLSTPITTAFSRGIAPCLLGFDPRVQFVEQEDVIRCLAFVIRTGLAGTYNVAGDGLLPWSEVASLAGARLIPLPPVAPGALAGVLARLGLVELPPELLTLLRYGRGVDTTRLKRAGFAYTYTSAGAVERFARTSRLRRTVGSIDSGYRYEQDVEQFFRHSPAVVRDA